MKVKTTLTWTGSGPAPSKVKVCLNGEALASTSFGQLGSYSASNGLGHPEQTGSSAMGIPGCWAGSASSQGKKYREFSSSGGTVSFKTDLSAVCSGVAMLTARTNFSATESPWAVSISSDRGETFRRVADAAGVRKVSNYFEDDGVTSRGGDGKVYGDSAATLPNLWNGFDLDFASTFTPSASGPWSNDSTGSLSSSRELSRNSANVFTRPWYQTIVCGFEDLEMKGTSPLDTFTVDASASDPTNAISDSCKYEMKVHLPAEKAESLGTSSGTYLHRASETLPGYDNSRHAPKKVFVAAAANLPVSFTYTTTDTTEIKLGFEYTLSAGLELDIKLAKLIFGEEFKLTGEYKVTQTTSVGSNFTIPAGTAVVCWACEFGSVEKVLTSRYNDSGFFTDATEFVVKSDLVGPVWKGYPIGTSTDVWP
jgi:hypothetical protein